MAEGHLPVTMSPHPTPSEVPFSPPRNQSTGPQGMTKYSHTRKLTGGMELAQGHTVGRRKEALEHPGSGALPLPQGMGGTDRSLLSSKPSHLELPRAPA